MFVTGPCLGFWIGLDVGSENGAFVGASVDGTFVAGESDVGICVGGCCGWLVGKAVGTVVIPFCGLCDGVEVTTILGASTGNCVGIDDEGKFVMGASVGDPLVGVICGCLVGIVVITTFGLTVGIGVATLLGGAIGVFVGIDDEGKLVDGDTVGVSVS